MFNYLNEKHDSNYFKTHIFFSPILIVLFIFAYHTTFHWMYERYVGADSYYSHGFLIPFVSLFLIWQKRDYLKSLPHQQNWSGLILIIFALVLHILGTVLYIFSISGFSIFFLALGFTLFLFGEKIFKAILFPILLLIFMFPLPEAVISLFSFPLKIFAAKAGVWAVSIFGIPVHLEGFNIFIPAGHLLVGNPCSGLRSLIAFLAIGSIFAYITTISIGKKFFLFLVTIPIAIFSNIIRIPILIIVSHYWGLEAAAPDTLVHIGSGIFVFIIGFLLLLVTAEMLK